MQKYLKSLKTSSVVIKVVAWIFLCLGILGGVSVIFGLAPGSPRWTGIIILAIYGFFFFFFNLIAKIALILREIISEIKKEQTI